MNNKCANPTRKKDGKLEMIYAGTGQLSPTGESGTEKQEKQCWLCIRVDRAVLKLSNGEAVH